MLVSVVIPAYNQAGYLKEAIDSALAQTYSPIEIIVVDDGSTDKTKDLCLSYGDRVRYFYQNNDGTKGGGARNCAIREANGHWVALLDQDDIWLPQKIEKQVAAVRFLPRLGAVFTQVKFIGPKGEEVDGTPIQGESGMVFHRLLVGNMFYASSGMFKKKILDVEGYPDVDTVSDWDLWLRISRSHEVCILGDILTHYRQHPAAYSSECLRMVDRSLELLGRMQTRLHNRCKICVDSLSFGVKRLRKHAARSYLDRFHADMQSRSICSARLHLFTAFQISPRDVLYPRNVLAIAKKCITALFSPGYF
jgi:glycosyltransferase involved in cell wall biosynthesis